MRRRGEAGRSSSATVKERLDSVGQLVTRSMMLASQAAAGIRRIAESAKHADGEPHEAESTWDAHLEDMRTVLTDLKSSVAKLESGVEDASARLDLESDAVQRSFREALQGYRQESAQLRGRLKRLSVALVDARKQVDRAKRRELLSGGMDMSARKALQTGGSTSAMMMWQSREATAALERSRDMLSSDLERIASVADIMDRDSETLAKTMHEHEGVGADAATTSHSISILWRRRMTDQVLQVIGIALFVLVVLYILYRRARWAVGVVPFLS